MARDTGREQSHSRATPAHHGVELRHLRYLVAVADAGTFTQAAERMFITQPTLSQQIRQLENMVGTPLLFRRREGVRLTEAGRVLLEESRAVLALFEHALSRSRQAAGLACPQLRFALPPSLPERLAIWAASRLRSAAVAAHANVVWLEAPLDAEFSLIRERRADAGLGWRTSGREPLPDELEVMTVGDFVPEVWIPASSAADRAAIDLAELAGMEVIYGPRSTSPGTYDAWRATLRASRPRFEFANPPVRHSLPITLALASTAASPTAVLTGPLRPAGGQQAARAVSPEDRDSHDMVRVDLNRHPLTATAVIAWNGDLPRRLQQVLFDTASADVAIPPPRPLPPRAPLTTPQRNQSLSRAGRAVAYPASTE
jgi:DNA-binding transcriptional LysR family regulator